MFSVFRRKTFQSIAPLQGAVSAARDKSGPTLFLQRWLWQLLFRPPHILPLAHAGHAPPPQSTSVSVPFLIPSPHDGAWQVPAPQLPL